jgi:1-deoxy-D-xylulose-5-phosphate synthase
MLKPLLPTIHSPADLKQLNTDQLIQLAEEIRQAICEQVARSGGHLAPNLGVVELTIALHYVFDFSSDRLLFDVGHQCYVHKLLTGRLPLLSKLRQRGGMAGFPEPLESDFDLFSVGHAGTSISTAVGMARGDAMLGEENRRVVSLIGDASIVNGVALEGLNNAGTLQRQFLVILNDNGMSIAKPQGALATYFDKIRVNPAFSDLKKQAKKLLDHLPLGETIEHLYQRAGEAVRAALHPDHFFSGFGLVCIGPIDGHNMSTLIETLQQVKDYNRPLLLHCKTIKGKGFEFTKGDPTAFHSPSPFKMDLSTVGCRVEIQKSGRSFTTAFADAMLDLMKKDEKVFAVTAAMPDGTGISKVLTKFPQRALDTGICESHAMDMCAGMAKSGVKPFFAVYSTFAQRAVDQVFQEVALQGLPVRVCMDRAGFVGSDGAVHHGFIDIAIFKPFPGTVLLAASDEPNLRAGLEFMRSYDDGATFIRYPRENVPNPALMQEVPPYELGKALLVKPAQTHAPDLAILAYGTQVYESHKALASLKDAGSNIALYDARFAKPIDIELLTTLAQQQIPILTIEDHALVGGFGASVLEAMNERHLPTEQVYRMGMPEKWIYQDSRANQLAEVGLDAKGIALKIDEIFNQQSNKSTKKNTRSTPLQELNSNASRM